MRLATWNVNSIRSRIDRVTDWLERADVDVLAMQETKCTDAQFPTMPFAALGYDVAHVGFNQWNGVAIASRVGLDDVEIGLRRAARVERRRPRPGRSARRAAGCGSGACTCPTAAPSRTRTTPTSWNGLPRLRNTAAGWLADDPAAPIALVGDWNIAPTDDDVWDVEFFQRQHPRHRTRARGVPRHRGRRFADVVRPFTPAPGTYTYWDYTQLRFPKRQGMRIDFILGSPALAARVTHAEIVRDERKPGKKGTPAPSDHAPVLVDVSDGA